MPPYMDIYRGIDGLMEEVVEGTHQKNLEKQTKYRMEYLKYWFDETSGKIFCLIETPGKQAVEATPIRICSQSEI